MHYYTDQLMTIDHLRYQVKTTTNNDELKEIKKLVEKIINTRGGIEFENLLQDINEKMKPHLPKTLIDIRKALLERKLECSNNKEFDGRTNSCIDENKIISFLIHHPSFKEKIRKAENRFWYDVKVYDSEFGWVPVNVKTTTIKTADNVGNMSICLQAFTDEAIDIDERYNNGSVTNKFINKLKNKEYNTDFRKDYYFLVVNKDEPSQVIVNSVLGVSNITPNVNNLPFQIKWINNKDYSLTEDEDVQTRVVTHLQAIQQKAVKTWQEKFLSEFRVLSLADKE